MPIMMAPICSSACIPTWSRSSSARGSSSLIALPAEADFTSPIAPILGAKRGPKTVVSDSEIVTAIRTVLAATPSHGEGYWRFARGSPIAGSRSAASACG